ncbi:unnamed protein product [Callosobruchus maculatus]|uniref:Endonuclease/exonuclease/phosphatase domain-containing protein n=1 Tax=Callosobruchus maculatus TaxID=64391 RepID=A0A653D2N5_CALMS|nr:unnamed protein product [Callosobruchus maculatus]
MLNLLIKNENPLVICLQETRIKEGRYPFPPKNYQGYFKNRPNQEIGSGDVAIFTKNRTVVNQ